MSGELDGTAERLHGRLARLRVAFVHDWLLGMRGGEWVLAELLKLLPNAEIHTLFHDPRGIDNAINRYPIRPSPLNDLPGVRRYYRWLLPLMPGAIEAMRFAPRTELVISISHCVALGARRPAAAVHVNYFLSPMRYLYDQQSAYRRGGGLGARLLGLQAGRLRRWNVEAALRADQPWAISHYVAARVRRELGVDCHVIHPPVRTDVFTPPPAGAARVDEDLVVSAMVPYKRVDLAVQAANRLQRPLRVVGDGPGLAAIRRLAGPTVTVEGRVSEARLRELYRTRRALIFTAEEDYGIVPLEALACGMPVLGLGRGGLLETMVEAETATFFGAAAHRDAPAAEPTADELAEAWGRFDPGAFDPQRLRARAETFSVVRFLDRIAAGIEQALGE